MQNFPVGSYSTDVLRHLKCSLAIEPSQSVLRLTSCLEAIAKLPDCPSAAHHASASLFLDRLSANHTSIIYSVDVSRPVQHLKASIASALR